MVSVVSPKGASRWMVLDGTVLGSLCPALLNLSVNGGWRWSRLLYIMEEGAPFLQLGWRWAGRCSEPAAQRSSHTWDVRSMLGCFPNEREALPSLFEVVYFLSWSMLPAWFLGYVIWVYGIFLVYGIRDLVSGGESNLLAVLDVRGKSFPP